MENPEWQESEIKGQPLIPSWRFSSSVTKPQGLCDSFVKKAVSSLNLNNVVNSVLKTSQTGVKCSWPIISVLPGFSFST